MLLGELLVKFILMIYLDGGFDYRLTYYLVKFLFIVLFRNLNFDMLIVGRIVLGYLWVNLVERIMLVLNLFIQNMLFVRNECDSNIE